MDSILNFDEDFLLKLQILRVLSILISICKAWKLELSSIETSNKCFLITEKTEQGSF